MDGSLELSQYFLENKINAHRITSRSSTLNTTTHDWYKDNMPWFDRSLLHIQSDGDSIKSSFKVDKICELGVNFHFEDSVEHAQEITAKSNTIIILVPQPWNEDFIPEEGSKIIKTASSQYQFLPKLIRVYMNLANIIHKFE